MKKLLLILSFVLVFMLSACTSERVLTCTLNLGSSSQTVEYTYTRNYIVSINNRNQLLTAEEIEFFEDLYRSDYEGVDLFEIMDLYKSDAENEGYLCEID